MLEIQNLCYTYPGGYKALHQVSIAVEQGSKVFFHGPNGAGKTTLFQCMNGLLHPESGNILLDGKPLKKDSERMRRMGIVFQNPDDQLICGSVYDELAFGPLHMGLDQAAIRERVAWALKALDLSGLRDRPPHLLSFGQKRRVTIGAVLSMGQDILLLDEPTAGLDARQSQELTRMLDKLAGCGKTLLISTHDAAFSHRCADKVAVLNEGRLLAFGTPDAIFSNNALLAQAGMSPPPVSAVYQALLEKGLVSCAAQPHSLEELLALIAEM